MENKLDILNELNEISPAIAAMEKVNIFTVPQGYFEFLSTDIMTGIETEKGSKSEGSSISSSHEIPHGYFDNLADTILQKIKVLDAEDASAELRALSPMLYSIQNENVFEVPEGYFENLSDDVLDKVLLKQSKVIVMRRRSTTFFKYAVAAAFTGVMALGVFKFTGTKQTGIKLPDYVEAGLQVQNVDQELAKISDEEIVKYLETNGSDVRTALLANSIDENELPSQEDYLLDEKTLDKYLNSINLGNLKN